jgi:hypothetical protein
VWLNGRGLALQVWSLELKSQSPPPPAKYKNLIILVMKSYKIETRIKLPDLEVSNVIF